MPYTKIWIHLVWSTKNRTPFLSDDLRQKVFEHIRNNALKKDIELAALNGYPDHVHALLRLKTDQTISKVAQLLKGESSFWINKNKLTLAYFEWQDEYFAVSVSESALQN